MALDIDRYAHRESSLKRWDPRIKLLTMGIFVFIVALLDTLPVAYLSLLFALMFLRLSNIPFSFIRGGVMFVSLFLLPLFFIMPFSYPGESPSNLLGFNFAWEGFRLACLIIIKALAVVIIAYGVFGSNRFDISMIALQHLRVPRLIVQMLLFTYRYIFVFLAEMRRMDVSMRSRGLVKKFDLATLKIMGNFIGTLLIRSFERTERIYDAMLSKGYDGEFHTMIVFQSQLKDYLKAMAILVLIIVFLWLEVSSRFQPAINAWY